MKRFGWMLLSYLITCSVAAQREQPEVDLLIEQQMAWAASAQAIIDGWRNEGEGDVAGKRPLVITLFTGSDTEPAPDYRARLTRTMKHIQRFYAKEMERNGFGPLTFGLQTEDDGLLKIHVVKGDRPNAEYNGEHGREIRGLVNRQLAKAGIEGDKQTLVIFCNLTKWDPVQRRMSHHSPYYAIGSSRSGTAWQLDSALLDAEKMDNTDRDLFLRDGQYGRISLGRYQSIFVGGVCHELGHALGLPHNKQRADEAERWGTALMGSGNFTYGEEARDEGPGSFLTFAHALKLAVHPSFSGSVKQMRTRPKSRYTDLKLAVMDGGKGVRITGIVESNIPIHAVLAYLDPEGRRDYNATTHVAVPDDQGRFTVDCTSFAGRKGRIRLVRVHANGWAQFSEDIGMAYTRDGKGVLDVAEPDLNNQRTDTNPADSGRVYSIPPHGCHCWSH